MLDIVKVALAEDVGPGDLTSLACLEPGPVRAVIMAKSDGVLSGLKPALLTFDIVDSANIITPLKSDGDRFRTGDRIVDIDGFNQTVLTAERTALNFLGHLSGIATLTGQFVNCVRGTSCRILDTRKTVPGLRHLEKMAVEHGGGCNHRMGLYDMVLIKDNHIASAGSIAAAVERTRGFLDTADFRLQFSATADEIKIEVEVSTEEQIEKAIAAGVDRLLIDNVGPEKLTSMVALARGKSSKIELEASGNVSLGTVADIAASGVDFVSIGALTHSAASSDFSLLVCEANG